MTRSQKKPGLETVDYSQIELRILAHMVDPLHSKQGIDAHAIAASEMLNVPVDSVDPMMRRRVKVTDFGIIYGTSTLLEPR